MVKYQIQINEPCSEDWHKMTNLEKGKFCNSCKKQVFDFTQFSNIELARKIKKGENLCGRFKEEQLNTDLILPQKSFMPKFGYMLSFLGLLGFSSPILSQIKTKEKTTINWSQSKSDTNNNTRIKKRIVKGFVDDRSGELPGVSVLIKGTRVGVETDYNGNFELIIDKKYLKNNNIILQFSYLGYKTKTIIITKKNYRKKIKVTLVEDANVLGGYGIIEKRNLFDKTIYYTRKIFNS